MADRPESETSTVERPRPLPLAAVVRVHGGAPYRLSQRAVVGSSRTADIVIADSTVSRQHAELSLVPEGVLVKDLGSRNGVVFQGQLVSSIVLGFGGRVQLGNVELGIELAGDDLAGALPPFRGESYGAMIGRSAAMRELFAKLARLEGSLVTVLVQGESGAGKELVARALHDGSRVAAGPFVPVNCGAFARELIVSELFGHKRGAFTGAQEDRRGAFDRADGGTLFLDEIGELPLEVQPTLLRALELGEVRAVGAESARRVKVRVVAATNRDLRKEAAAGRFREDLLYRLAVVTLEVPPLSARPDDVELLARRFAAAHGHELAPAALQRLRSRAWPGNVRELKNAIEAYVALGVLPDAARDPAALEHALRGAIDVSRPYAEQKEALLDLFGRLYLDRLLEHTDGNQSTAARVSGLTRTHLGRMIDKYGVRKGRR